MSRRDSRLHDKTLGARLLRVAVFTRCGRGGKPFCGRNALQKYLLIAIGGALGSIARYWVGSTIGSRMGTRFPYGTFVINLSACIIIGFTVTYLGKRVELSPAWRYLILCRFCRRLQHVLHFRMGDALHSALRGFCNRSAVCNLKSHPWARRRMVWSAVGRLHLAVARLDLPIELEFAVALRESAC